MTSDTKAPSAADLPEVAPNVRYYRRFDPVQRGTHVALMISFLGLALTGMPLLFADQEWAAWLARLWGGFETAGLLHRACALIMIATFTAHVGQIAVDLVKHKDYGVLWGPNSMVPQPRDLLQMVQHFRWFIGLGPRPDFDRFTYWEKFDYWAVFWGMVIIGGSGLMLWFPEFFSLFLPGWIFNVAMLVHGEEALLAVGFIFTVHFFNGHLRPEKFPMDLVIFTGRVSEAEIRHERPAEWRRLQAEGSLARVESPPPSARSVRFGGVVGTAGVLTGLVMVALIVYALLL